MKNILYIGNHLPSILPTGVHTLSGKLREEGYSVITASDKQGKLWRLTEMLATVYRNRKWADFVLIDTYSTRNFWYAFAVAKLCRRLGLRYIPILHGGELPRRMREWPRASEVVFGGAYVNVVPSKYLMREVLTEEGLTTEGTERGTESAEVFNSGFRIINSEFDFSQRRRDAEGLTTEGTEKDIEGAESDNSEFRIQNSEFDFSQRHRDAGNLTTEDTERGTESKKNINSAVNFPSPESNVSNLKSNSSSLKDRSRPVPTRGVMFIPNSLNLSQYPFKKRAVFGPKLLWVRAFQGIYNPMLALQVLEELLRKYPGAELGMVGPKKDASWEACREYAQEKGLPVKFTGKLEKREWLELSLQCDIFLNTTLVDNTPVSVMEAMALGLVVVSTEVGGLPYLIETGKDGILVAPGDPEAMARAVESVVARPEWGMALAGRAREKVEGFDWGVVREQWIGLLG